MNIQSILSMVDKYNTEILIALLGGLVLLLIINIVGQVRISSIRKKYNRLVEGSQGTDLENILFEIKDELGQIKIDIDVRDKELASIKDQLGQTIQKKGLIRYNALDELGSNQSYSLTLLDPSNSGFIITSLYGRDFNASYIKPIKAGKSEYNLSKEEDQSLKLALEN